MNEWTNERNEMKWNEMNEINGMNEWMNEWNEWVNEWMNGWMNGWMDEWMNG